MNVSLQFLLYDISVLNMKLTYQSRWGRPAHFWDLIQTTEWPGEAKVIESTLFKSGFRVLEYMGDIYQCMSAVRNKIWQMQNTKKKKLGNSTEEALLFNLIILPSVNLTLANIVCKVVWRKRAMLGSGSRVSMCVTYQSVIITIIRIWKIHEAVVNKRLMP